MRTRVLAVVLVGIAAMPAAADIDNAKADQLFKEAVALRDKDPGAACLKFEEALGYNPQAISTRLNVALCDERMGRIASAVAKFTEVADRARTQGLGEFLRLAEDKIAALAPDVPKVTFELGAPIAPGLKLVIDNEVVPLDKLVELPIDPGARIVTASAPARLTYTTTLTIAKRDRRTFKIPALASASSAKSTRRPLGKVTLAAGGAIAVTGIVLGVVAKSRYDSAVDEFCDHRAPGTNEQVCESQGIADIKSARTLGNVGTALTVVGVGAALAGGFLWWRSPRSERAGVAYVGAQAGPTGAVVVAAGRF